MMQFEAAMYLSWLSRAKLATGHIWPWPWPLTWTAKIDNLYRVCTFLGLN